MKRWNANTWGVLVGLVISIVAFIAALTAYGSNFQKFAFGVMWGTVIMYYLPKILTRRPKHEESEQVSKIVHGCNLPDVMDAPYGKIHKCEVCGQEWIRWTNRQNEPIWGVITKRNQS